MKPQQWELLSTVWPLSTMVFSRAHFYFHFKYRNEINLGAYAHKHFRRDSALWGVIALFSLIALSYGQSFLHI